MYIHVYICVYMCGAERCRVLQCVALWCSVLQCVAEFCTFAHSHKYRFGSGQNNNVPLERISQCLLQWCDCSVLQCVVVCCSVLQCVAMCCKHTHSHLHTALEAAPTAESSSPATHVLVTSSNGTPPTFFFFKMKLIGVH